ncbi:MAG: GWxTD domain-containing protein [Candidatus Aminicenantaceae bacterium]
MGFGKMKKPVLLLFFFIYSLLLVSCASYRLQKNLDPESREFISKVRYIITQKERKVFLNLQASEQKAFIEEFWKSRDPDPDTEENEYKEEYFKRIEEANRLFKEGSPGWLQDRGRVYILLGPPWERQTFPRGINFYDKPQEIWYYGYFVIRFIDNDWSGEYRLVPDSSWQIAELNKAQMILQPKGSDEKYPFDFDLKVKKAGENEVAVKVDIPYKNIWFEEKEGQLIASLKLTMDIFDSSKKKVWEHKKNYQLDLTEEELEAILVKDYTIEIRVELAPGKYTYTAEIINLADGNRSRKNGKFSV